MNISRINLKELLQRQCTKAVGGHALIALVATALVCSACRYSVPSLGSTRQPTAFASPIPSGIAVASPLPGGAAAASDTPTPLPVATLASTPTANPIRVVKVLPNMQVVSNQEYSLRNCGGNTPLRQPFSTATQVSTTVAVADQATLSDGTTIPVSESARSGLAHEVELAYEDELTAARATLDQTEMVAPPYTNWQITIIWEDRSFAASVSFPSDGLTAMAAYTYTQHVPIMGYQKPVACTP